MKTGLKSSSKNSTNYAQGSDKPDAMPISAPTEPRAPSNMPDGPTSPDIDSSGDQSDGRGYENPLGSQMDNATADKHQRGVSDNRNRQGYPSETAPSLSKRNTYPRQDLTQKKVHEANDPTHDGSGSRNWEDGQFEDRRKFY